MLQFKKGSYTRKQVLCLQRIFQEALDNLQCDGSECGACDYNRPCADVCRVMSYLSRLLDSME